MIQKSILLWFCILFLLFTFCKLIFEIEDSGDSHGIYFSYGGNIFRMNYDGSYITPLTFDKEDNNNPQLTRDGSYLIYETQDKSNMFSSSLYDYSEINVMDLEDNDVDVIVDTYNFCFRPSVSFDGRYLAFCSNNSLGKRIATSDIRGGNFNYITDYGRYDHPVYMADGKHVLCQYDDDLYTNLILINIKNQTIKQLTNTSWNINAVLSPDGSRVVWESGEGIDMMNSDGNNQERIVKNHYFSARTPSFSNCSNKVVYIIERTYNDPNMQNEIHIINLKTNETKLILKKGYNFYPKYFPDDSRILFSQYEDNQFYVCVIDTSGNGYQRFCRGSNPYIY